MGFSLKTKGDLSRTKTFLNHMTKQDYLTILNYYGQRGVSALEAATPIDSGETARSWSYSIQKSAGKATIVWTNNHLTKTGTPIAIMLQYGHGTGTGGYVRGKDYINPAIKPIFDDIAEEVWKVVQES